LLCLATFVPSKNQELALRAFLQAGCPNATLLFIGHEFNSYAEHLRALAGAARVRLLAGLPPTELAESYAACDVVVLSSRAETQPLVLLDAMAAGRPFISTNVGCVGELPGGVVVANQDDMAAAMRTLIREPEQRARLAAAGRAACETTYNWPHVIDRYEALLTQLTARR
jgi:glycosyltransferase involved in cell wall biosynthesis